jgi:hypothetical protein
VVRVPIRRVLWATLVALASLLPAAAWAQGSTHPRIQDELEATDRRIQLAASLVSGSASTLAQAELDAARQIQQRAQAAFAANQPVLALSATLSARQHADRAIALVRGLPDPDRVQGQVERTRDIVDRARERIDGCDNTRARALLRVALEMQQRAEAAMDESRYLAALQLSMSARERVLKAMRLCNLEDSIADAATRALQRTDELIGRARTVVDGAAPGPAQDMLARAESIQAQALSELRLEHHESALRLTQAARGLARRAMGFGASVGRPAR